MGSGGSALQEATAQQVQEAFAGLSPEEQKKAQSVWGGGWGNIFKLRVIRIL